MAKFDHSHDELPRIAASVSSAIPQLFRLIAHQNLELQVERERRIKAEERAEVAEAEAERWYHETLRLEARLP